MPQTMTPHMNNDNEPMEVCSLPSLRPMFSLNVYCCCEIVEHICCLCIANWLSMLGAFDGSMFRPIYISLDTWARLVRRRERNCIVFYLIIVYWTKLVLFDEKHMHSYGTYIHARVDHTTPPWFVAVFSEQNDFFHLTIYLNRITKENTVFLLTMWVRNRRRTKEHE